MNPLLLLKMIFSSYMTKTLCVGGRHKSNTNNIMEYEKVNPNNKKVVKVIKGICIICGPIKSQIFTK